MTSELKTALTSPEFSLAIAGNIIGIMKDKMKQDGIRSFPVITLIGEPGTGKTAIIRASTCTKRDEIDTEISFYESKKEIISKLSDDFSRFEYTYVDDFANLTTDTGRRSQKNTIDTITRMGFKGECKLLALTIEKSALRYLSTSCQSRMLFVDIGKGVNNTQCADTLTFLQESDDLLRHLIAFESFFDKRHYPFADELKQYRKQVCQNEKNLNAKRIAEMVFCYKTAMLLFNEYMQQNGHDSLDMAQIEKIEAQLLSNKKLTSMSVADIANDMVKRLIFSGELNVGLCEVKDECTRHLSVGCDKRSDFCDPNHCQIGVFPKWKTTYALNDLFLDYQSGINAVLIDDPQMVPHFKRLHKIPPFIIIDSDILTSKINLMLAQVHKEIEFETFYFTSEKLHKALFKSNRCMAMSNGDKGHRYTFSHPAFFEDEHMQMRAVFLFLTDEEKAHLLNTAHSATYFDRMKRYSYSPHCGRIISSIQNIWSQFLISPRPVGEPES